MLVQSPVGFCSLGVTCWRCGPVLARRFAACCPVQSPVGFCSLGVTGWRCGCAPTRILLAGGVDGILLSAFCCCCTCVSELRFFAFCSLLGPFAKAELALVLVPDQTGPEQCWCASASPDEDGHPRFIGIYTSYSYGMGFAAQCHAFVREEDQL